MKKRFDLLNNTYSVGLSQYKVEVGDIVKYKGESAKDIETGKITKIEKSRVIVSNAVKGITQVVLAARILEIYPHPENKPIKKVIQLTPNAKERYKYIGTKLRKRN